MRYIFPTNLRAFELAGGQNRHGQQERHPADNQQHADDQHRPARMRRTCCGNRWPDRGNRIVFIRAFGLLLSGGQTARHHSLLPPDHAPQLFPPGQSLGQRQLAVRPVDTLARCASEEAAHMRPMPSSLTHRAYVIPKLAQLTTRAMKYRIGVVTPPQNRRHSQSLLGDPNQTFSSSRCESCCRQSHRSHPSLGCPSC